MLRLKQMNHPLYRILKSCPSKHYQYHKQICPETQQQVLSRNSFPSEPQGCTPCGQGDQEFLTDCTTISLQSKSRITSLTSTALILLHIYCKSGYFRACNSSRFSDFCHFRLFLNSRFSAILHRPTHKINTFACF